MSANDPTRGAGQERLVELLCDDAMLGLTEAERAEFEALCREFPGVSDGSFERAAAAADLAMSGARVEAMPEHVRSKIIAAGERITAELAVGSGVGVSGGVGRVGARTGPARMRTTSGATRERDSFRFGGWLAAAAAIVVAAIAWMRPAGNTATDPGPVTPIATVRPNDARERLMASAADAVVIPLADWDNPEQPGVTGDVVWSESAQTGYLRLAGLKPNDPTVEQYQLWIVDSRGMGQRISGALFDARPDPATGEVVVEIEPQIATQGAAAFALTIEKPGGVWVSDMTRRVVIGAKG